MINITCENDNSAGVFLPLPSIILGRAQRPLPSKMLLGPSEFNSEGPTTCGILAQPIRANIPQLLRASERSSEAHRSS